MSVDELAKAMTDHHPIPGVCLPRGAVEVTCREHARAACEFFHITPEQAERMEKGAVGKAVALLRDVQSKYDICDLDYYTGYARGGIDLALRELGEEVSRG